MALLHIGDAPAILEALEAVAQRLSSPCKSEVAREECEVAQRLPVPPFTLLEEEEAVREELLRGAVGPANSLAAWAPSLPDSTQVTEALAAGDEAAARRILDIRAASLLDACQQASDGSAAVHLIFGLLWASRRCGAEVDRATAYRLASSCSLVFGPAINTACLLQLHALLNPQCPGRVLYLNLALCLARLLAATADSSVEWLHTNLGLPPGRQCSEGEKAAVAALRATACKPAVLCSFWRQTTSVLAYCADQDFGEDETIAAALDSLVSFTAAGIGLDHGEGPLTTALRAQGGAAAEPFMRLVATQHHAAVATLLRALRRQAGEAPVQLQEAQLTAWLKPCSLLSTFAPAAATAVAAAEVTALATRLVPAYLRGALAPGYLLSCVEAQTNLANPWVKSLPYAHAAVGCGQPRPQAAPQLPAGCWEVAAVCAAGLQAVVEREGQLLRAQGAAGSGAAGADVEAQQRLVQDIKDALGSYEAMFGQLRSYIEALAEAGLSAAAALSPPDLAVAAAAVEAMVRVNDAIDRAPQLLPPHQIDGERDLEALAEPLMEWLAAHPGYQLSADAAAALRALLDSLTKAALNFGSITGDGSGLTYLASWCGVAWAAGRMTGQREDSGTAASSTGGRWADAHVIVLARAAASFAARAEAAGSGFLAGGAEPLIRIASCVVNWSSLPGLADRTGLPRLLAAAVRAALAVSWEDDPGWDVLQTLVSTLLDVLGKPKWQGIAGCLVREGLLDDLVGWAAQTSRMRAARPPGEVHRVLNDLLSAVVSIGMVAATGPNVPPTEEESSLGSPVVKALHDCQVAYDALSAQRQRQKLAARQFWEQEVGQLLPAIRARAEIVHARSRVEAEGKEGPGAVALLEARALASRPCANALCTNMSGCSERRLRGRRCSGCRAVRYCGLECQRADWAQHARVCAALASDA